MRALTRYRRNLPANRMSGTTLILLAAAIGLVIWFLLKNKGSISQGSIGQYQNKEEWNVSYDKDGLPVKISITRNATRT